MTVTKENASKTEVKLTVTLTPEEVQPFLITAATHISEHMDMKGFRRGKATFEAVTGNVGEMAVLQEALEPIVRLHLDKALMDEAIETVGQPKVDIQKMVPGNELVFSATVTRMPEIKKLGNYEKVSIDAKSTDASQKDIDRALKDLTGMRTKEVRGTSSDAVTDKDMLVVDLQMTREGVPVDGGQSPNFRVYMNEEHYVPGMKEPLLGMKEGEQKTFTVAFPKDHYQKSIAGKDVECSVTVKELYHLEVPTIDDAFAVSLGLKDEAELCEKITENLKTENEQEETRRQEKEALELLAEKSSFTEIPEFLVDDEVEKMVHELEHAVERQGGAFTEYLQSIKKSPKELRDGMREQGLMRVKVALLLRAVAKAEGIAVAPDEVQTEIEKQAAMYGKEEEARERVLSPEYRDYTSYRMRNEKVVAFLRGKMVKPAK